MEVETYLIYLAAVAVFFATPPDTSQLLIISNSIRYGLRRSAFTIAGDLSANVLQMTGAAFGLAAIIATSASAFTWIKWLGVAYLVWIGLQLMLAKDQPGDVSAADSGHKFKLFRQGFVTSMANPFAVASFRAVLQDMETHLTAAPVFKIDTFLKTLAAAEKTFRVAKRRDASAEWDELLKTCARLTQLFKQRAAQGEEEEEPTDESAAAADDGQEGIPSSTAVYLGRLKRQRKELYKNPPVLPPNSIVVEAKRAPLPTRDADGFLTFEPGSGKYDKSAVLGFKPNCTPEEILRGGAFGGTYFRSIVSAVTNRRYAAKDVLKESVPDKWIQGLDAKTMLTSQNYDINVNKFGAKCGGCE